MNEPHRRPRAVAVALTAPTLVIPRWAGLALALVTAALALVFR